MHCHIFWRRAAVFGAVATAGLFALLPARAQTPGSIVTPATLTSPATAPRPPESPKPLTAEARAEVAHLLSTVAPKAKPRFREVAMTFEPK